jgi:D-arabinitol 4-dehydrogenase
MVDRITPRPTPDVIKRIQRKAKTTDHIPITAESFIQWVVEDNFAAGRPCLEKVGVEMTNDVEPWEEAKIRILNATHAAIAWAGTMLGFKYIHESVNHEKIHLLALDYISQDVIPSLSPSSIDLTKYRDIVLARFSNPHLLDTNQRVAADGLSKIPGMITPTLHERYLDGKIPSATAVLPALFFLFLRCWV